MYHFDNNATATSSKQHIHLRKMGAWGYGLLMSDQELDIMADISNEAGKLAKIPHFSFWYPQDQDEVVRKLNDGIFHQLLEKFKAKKWKHGIIYLGALSMRLGVTISQEDMQVLSNALKRTRMYEMAKWQMDCALKGYKNGEPWNFEGLGLVKEMRNGTNKYINGHGKLSLPLAEAHY